MRQEQSLCDAEVCGSRGPEVEGSAACNTARRRRDPAESPLIHLHEGENRFFLLPDYINVLKIKKPATEKCPDNLDKLN